VLFFNNKSDGLIRRTSLEKVNDFRSLE